MEGIMYKVTVNYKDGTSETFSAEGVGLDPSGRLLCITQKAMKVTTPETVDKVPTEQTCILLDCIKSYSFRKIDS
jgi:hypothetical protein